MISVCIATYNGERYIHEQLSSILSQLRTSDEIIISDDSSTDKTLNIIRDFNDVRIKVYEGQHFSNPIFNFENALNKASGDVIFLADQDDIWSPDKVNRVCKELENSDMVVSDCSFINNDGKILVSSYFEAVGSGKGILRNLRKNTYLGCCMAFKRKLLKKALPFPKDIPMHDIWLGFVADLFFKPIFIKEKLVFYRKHDNNASITSDIISHNRLLKKFRFRINIVKYVFKLLIR